MNDITIITPPTYQPTCPHEGIVRTITYANGYTYMESGGGRTWTE